MKKRRKIFVCSLLSLSVLINFFYIKTEAYKFTGYTMSNPSNVKYLIGTSVGGYSADTLKGSLGILSDYSQQRWQWTLKSKYY